MILAFFGAIAAVIVLGLFADKISPRFGARAVMAVIGLLATAAIWLFPLPPALPFMILKLFSTIIVLGIALTPLDMV